MLGRTHIAFSLMLALVMIIVLHPAERLFFAVVVMFGSLLPDIDNHRSIFGMLIKPVSLLVQKIFGHRAFFHSLMPPVILFIAYLFYENIFIAALLIGYMSHLFLDTMTKAGAPLLLPFSSRNVRGFFNTAGSLDTMVFIASLMVSAMLVLSL